METLELRHITSYLPYGLKAHQRIWTQMGRGRKDKITTELKMVNSTTIYNFFELGRYVASECVKPVLFSIEMVYKKVEIDGEFFIPIERLKTQFGHELNIYMFFAGGLAIDVNTKGYPKTVDFFDGFEITNQLLRWKFDIFGLINKNLAVEVTEDNNPYK